MRFKKLYSYLYLPLNEDIMIIKKFGGTSVGSAERIKNVAELATSDSKPTIVVLSAMAGTMICKNVLSV